MLNKAGEKFEELQAQGRQDYNLISELEVDEIKEREAQLRDEIVFW